MEISGFYKLSVDERLALLKKEGILSEEDIKILLDTGSLKIDRANLMIENVLGVSHLPFSIATNFRINKKDYLVPMVIEEPSVVAAASHGAKLTLPEGFSAEADEPIMTGQLQIIGVSEESLNKIEENKKLISSLAKEYAKQMEEYGGGFRSFSSRFLKTKRGGMLILEFEIDVRDAMGANTVNTVMELIAPAIAEMVKGKSRLRIITNLAIKRKARAKAVWKKNVIGEETIERILDCYEMARDDIFRCATHNKGTMNGIDAVAMATGNDWRAVEAGAHSFASLNGYSPLTHFEKNKNGDLSGEIEIPLAVGIIGGAINSLPTSGIALKILGVNSAKELSMVMASVGLAQNLAALKALSTEGIQKGHMKLHARNIAILAGAEGPHEIDTLANKLIEEKKFNLNRARELLQEMKV